MISTALPLAVSKYITEIDVSIYPGLGSWFEQRVV